MDNPNTESSGSLDVDQAAALFSSVLDEKGEVPQKETKAEAPAETATEAKEPEAKAAEEAKPEDSGEMVEVDVDGFKVQLPKEKAEKLEAERMRQADYTRKTMQAAEEKKAAQAESQKAAQERQAYAQNLAQIRGQLELQAAQAQKIDFEALIQSNPQEALRQQHLANVRQAALQQVTSEQQKLAAQFEAERQQAYQSHLRAQHEELIAKLPEWKDEAKAKADRAAIRDYLLNQGYDEAAVSSVADAKAVMLARKAMLYDQMVEKAALATKKVSTIPAKAERPGTGAAPALDRRTAAYQRLSRTGSLNDAAAAYASIL